VFIIGGGPSLKLVNVQRLEQREPRRQYALAVNDSFMLGQWDAMFFADTTFWRLRGDDLRNFAGLKVTTLKRLRGVPGVTVVKKDNRFGLTTNRSVLSWNLSSGSTTISLAAHLGAKRIVLLGFDMRWVPTCEHCKYPKGSPDTVACNHCGKKGGTELDRNYHRNYAKRDPRKYNPYKGFMRSHPAIANDARQRGIEIVNATPGSAISHWPIVRPEDVLP
jgi:hypothetical protein